MLSAYSNDLVVSQAHHLSGAYEGIWSKVEIADSKPLYVGSIYRPPNPDVETLEALGQTLGHLTQKSPPNILLTGDFSLPSVSWAEDNYSIQPNPAYGIEVNNKLLDIVNSHFLTQHVKQPTRGHNILDLVFTSNSDMVTNLEVQSGISDYDTIIFMFKKGNMDAVRNDLKN